MVESIESMANRLCFVSLGGVWLDELRWPNKPALRDVVGGSGLYSTVGARLFARDDPSTIALVLKAGSDFPEAIIGQLRNWKVRLHVVSHPDRPSTRGVLEYGTDVSHPTFTRTNPPLLTMMRDLASEGLIASDAFHIFGSESMTRGELSELLSLRQAIQQKDVCRPFVVWEPYPKSCSRETLHDHLDVLEEGNITAFSPNHNELAAFFPRTYGAAGFNQWAIEAQARMFLQKSDSGQASGKSALQAIVVRAAEHGCMVLSQSMEEPVWLPPYWSMSNQDKVVDPTGAGNAFLGGLAMGWKETSDWLEAACYGTVAAGFVIEQIGPPTLEGEGDSERWAGEDVRRRLSEYQSRDEVAQVLKR